MSKRLRRFIFLAFSIVFLILAPLIVLYTAGYRYNFGTGSIVQTGVLSLTSTPKSARVSLDGKLLGSTTPTVFKNIFPGEHTIRLEKDGYTSWEKHLTVESRQTAFVENAVLFLNETPTLIRETTFTAVRVNPTRSKAVYTITQGQWAEIWVHDLIIGTESLVSRLPITTNTQIQFQWLDNDTILSIEAMNGEKSTSTQIDVTTNTPVDWKSDSDIVLTNRMDDVVVSRRQNETDMILAYLPYGDYQLIETAVDVIFLKEKNEDRIVLVRSLGGDQPILLNTHATSWQWEPSGTRLLYSDGFDLHVFDVRTQSDETLTRLSYAITNVSWIPGLPVVLYAQNDAIYAIEFDHRDYRIVTQVASGTNIQSFTTNSDGNTLYFFGTVGDKTGLFSKRLEK